MHCSNIPSSMGPDLTLPSPRSAPEKRYAEQSPLASARHQNHTAWQRTSSKNSGDSGILIRPGHKRQDSRPSPLAIKAASQVWSPESDLSDLKNDFASILNSSNHVPEKMNINAENSTETESSMNFETSFLNNTSQSSSSLMPPPNDVIKKSTHSNLAFVDLLAPNMTRSISSSSMGSLGSNCSEQDLNGNNTESCISALRASTEYPPFPSNMRKWTSDEDEMLRKAIGKYGGKNWKIVAEELGTQRTDIQCLHRWNQVLRPGLHKGPWTELEDRIVRECVEKSGVGKVKWSSVATRLPGRVGKQCRERWFNHLDPSIKRSAWTAEEDIVVFEAQARIGNRWCEIARLLPGRTENAVKNRYNSSAQKKWLKDHPNGTGTGESITPELLEIIKKNYEQEQAVARVKETKRLESIREARMARLNEHNLANLGNQYLSGMVNSKQFEMELENRNHARELELKELEQRALLEMQQESDHRFQTEMRQLQQASREDKPSESVGGIVGWSQRQSPIRAPAPPDGSSWQNSSTKMDMMLHPQQISSGVHQSNGPQVWQHAKALMDNMHTINNLSQNNATPDIIHQGTWNRPPGSRHIRQHSTPELYKASLSHSSLSPNMSYNLNHDMKHKGQLFSPDTRKPYSTSSSPGGIADCGLQGHSLTPGKAEYCSNTQINRADMVSSNVLGVVPSFSQSEMNDISMNVGLSSIPDLSSRNALNIEKKQNLVPQYNTKDQQVMSMKPPLPVRPSASSRNISSQALQPQLSKPETEPSTFASQKPMGFLFDSKQLKPLSINTSLEPDMIGGPFSSPSAAELSKLLLEQSPLNSLSGGLPNLFDFSNPRTTESPVSQAVRATRQTMGSGMQPNELVPLDMLPFFRYLNNDAQRSIMKQLIDQFQKTSLTTSEIDCAAVMAAAKAASAPLHTTNAMATLAEQMDSMKCPPASQLPPRPPVNPQQSQGQYFGQHEHLGNSQGCRERSGSGNSFATTRISTRRASNENSSGTMQTMTEMNLNIGDDFLSCYEQSSLGPESFDESQISAEFMMAEAGELFSNTSLLSENLDEIGDVRGTEDSDITLEMYSIPDHTDVRKVSM